MVQSALKNQLQSFLLILCSLVLCAQSDVPRPRGVSLSKAPLYSPTKDFTCFDGTATIPFSYVNDDYCDCFDGSDEPGTSACLNGVFHCTNAGHRPQNIPSSRVNDGVCDCCDGTDEYSNPDKCPDICLDLGREARAEAQRLAELHKAGSHVRAELIEKGNKKRSEMADQLSQLEKDKDEAEKIRNEKESLKNDLESKENEALQVYREIEEKERQKKSELEHGKTKKEATDIYNQIDSDSDDQLTLSEIRASNIFDKNKDGEVDEDEIQFFFGESENIDPETFISNIWPILKPHLMMEQGMFRPAQNKDEEHDSNAEELDDDQESEDGHDDEHIDDGDDVPNDDVDDINVTDSSKDKAYDEETQKLVNEATEARQQFTQADRTVRDIETNIRRIKENLEKDYGLQQEFATLDGECFEYEDKEYVYKLCMFQRVTQKSKASGSEIGLGTWGEWAGEDPNKYSLMKYTNGVNCWNGPNRITTVKINCGLENQLLSVTEPFRCEYNIELSTPAACDNSQPSHESHDEL